MSDLERLWDDLPVGRAPVDDILRAGRKQQRRQQGGPRRRPLRPLLTAGVLTAVGAAFIAGTVVGQPPSDGPGAAGPGGDDTASDVSPAAFHGELQPVASCDELLSHYQDEALRLVGPYGWELGYGGWGMMRDLAAFDDAMPAAPVEQARSANLSESYKAAPQTSTSTSSDTGTNVQEAGVDEPDVVKTDGELLVRIQGATLTTYDVTGESAEQLAEIRLEDFADGEVLLSGDTVVALGNDGARPRRTDYYAPPVPTATRVVSIDVSEPGTPEVTASVDLDTSLVSARQHGSAIRLVTAAGLPELDFVRPTGRRGVKTAREANERVVRETTLADWIPRISVDGGSPEQLADCADMAIPQRELGLDTMNVVGFEADDPAAVHAIGLAGAASLAYESPDHLYLAASPWSEWGWGRCVDVCPLASPALEDSGTTMVFDFEVSGTAATYVGSGEVEGSVADRWAMDEYDGVLRLAVGPTRATGNFNSVVTLERRGDELVEIGRVDDLGANEQIESVRWFDGLAILVTFRQIDPLYTIDLSDQDDPTLLGELKIPGFSEYLHPLGGRRLVGLGQGPGEGSRSWGAQAGLFKVTDLTDPRRIDTLEYAPGTQALAGADPRQFTWLPEERTLLTVISRGWRGRTGWVSVVKVEDGRLSNRMVEADYGDDVDQVRTVPLPDGRVVLVTGDDVEFFDL
jgi:hypothetical protein